MNWETLLVRLVLKSVPTGSGESAPAETDTSATDPEAGATPGVEGIGCGR